MGFVLGFLPWIFYWALVGNVDFRLAVCVSLAVASGTQLVSRMHGQTWRASKSALLIFVLLTAAATCCQRCHSGVLAAAAEQFWPLHGGARRSPDRPALRS
jgi:hypothetical protein